MEGKNSKFCGKNGALCKRAHHPLIFGLRYLTHRGSILKMFAKVSAAMGKVDMTETDMFSERSAVFVIIAIKSVISGRSRKINNYYDYYDH
jgi:hypothetical protein